ncbi:MAG: hypothetical protein HUU46_14760 [Candidatus Hydrogenedentes bacterium]|nr:hypothetical protein [Candidatus Hydrogenedentota bacterium]
MSLIVAASFVAAAYRYSGDENAFKWAMFYVLPLALIWFPDELANFTGSLGGQPITESSPPGCVYAAGWVILFLPAIMGAIVWVRS